MVLFFLLAYLPSAVVGWKFTAGYIWGRGGGCMFVCVSHVLIDSLIQHITSRIGGRRGYAQCTGCEKNTTNSIYNSIQNEWFYLLFYVWWQDDSLAMAVETLQKQLTEATSSLSSMEEERIRLEEQVEAREKEIARLGRQLGNDSTLEKVPGTRLDEKCPEYK